MAIYDASENGSNEHNMQKIDKKDDTKVFLVAQELNLARVLAGNNKTLRDRALKNLKRWFTQRSQTISFSEDDFQRIWKGLFYSMWMSDKLLVQEECAENISNLIHFPTIRDSLLFFKAGMEILSNEWNGIDQLRLNKFLMLVRRLLRQAFVMLKNNGLTGKNIKSFSDVLSETILNTVFHQPTGLFMHFTEIFLEELAKVTEGKIHTDQLVEFLRPFIRKLLASTDSREVAHIRKFIFTHLIRQSKLGLEYQEKYEAWKKQGFPGSINSMQKVTVDEQMSVDEENTEDDTEEKPLDPRAGRVNVELPIIKFKAKPIVKVLQEHKFDKDSNTKSRKIVTVLIDQFTELSEGVYPLGVKRVIKEDKEEYDTNIRKAVNRLVKFEKKLMSKSPKRKRKLENIEEPSEDATENKEKRRKTDEGNKNNKKRDSGETEHEEKPNEIKKKQKVHVEERVKNKRRGKNNRSNEETNKKQNSDNVEDAELKEFFKESEKIKNDIKRSLKSKSKVKRIRESVPQTVIDNIECIFERNSGTWIVYDVSSEEKQHDEIPSNYSASSPENGENNSGNLSTTSDTPSSLLKGESPTKMDESAYNTSLDDALNNKSASVEKATDKSLKSLSKAKGKKKRSPDVPKDTPSTIGDNGSPKGLNPVKLFESPPERKELFPSFEWDEPLQEGEYEICIPSKKYIGKMKKLAKKQNRSLHELINSPKIRRKSRMSLDPSIVKNPFSTPVSTKKVKINVKLNTSQEIHEHMAHIRRSPAIPYDANKKPSKPLLKTPVVSTPINPFYNKQLFDL